MFKRSRLSLPILLALLIGACVPAAQPATDIPQPSPTSSPALTATLEPSATPGPLTTEPAQPGTLATVAATVEPVVRQQLESPDRAWMAEIATSDCVHVTEFVSAAYEVLSLVNQQTQARFPVKDQLSACDGIDSYSLGGLVWSPNSRYLYFTNAFLNAPAAEDDLYRQPPLFQTDTTTQATTYLGKGVYSTTGQTIALVHDGCETRCLPDEIVALNLDGSILARYMPSIPRVATHGSGSAAFSPDERAAAFLVTYCTANSCMSSLYRLDLVAGNSTALFEQHQPSFERLSWDVPDAITLYTADSTWWLYTISAGTLEPAGP